eukprot:2399456-Rhodomonas_salina.1
MCLEPSVCVDELSITIEKIECDRDESWCAQFRTVYPAISAVHFGAQVQNWTHCSVGLGAVVRVLWEQKGMMLGGKGVRRAKVLRVLLYQVGMVLGGKGV